MLDLYLYIISLCLYRNSTCLAGAGRVTGSHFAWKSAFASPRYIYIHREREMCLYVGPISIYCFLMFVQREYFIPRARGVRPAPALRGNVHSPRPAINIYI